MSTRSNFNKNAVDGSKLIQQMSSLYCGVGAASQISSQYLGTNKNKRKDYAKADNFNLRQLAKRSNIPDSNTAS